MSKIRKEGYKPLVYVCAPYSGNIKQNKKLAKLYAQIVYSLNYMPLTPHFLFPFLNDNNPKEKYDAMSMDIILLSKCDEIWIFGDDMSEGMKKELQIAEKWKKVVRRLYDDEIQRHAEKPENKNPWDEVKDYFEKVQEFNRVLRESYEEI